MVDVGATPVVAVVGRQGHRAAGAVDLERAQAGQELHEGSVVAASEASSTDILDPWACLGRSVPENTMKRDVQMRAGSQIYHISRCTHVVTVPSPIRWHVLRRHLRHWLASMLRHLHLRRLALLRRLVRRMWRMCCSRA